MSEGCDTWIAYLSAHTADGFMVYIKSNAYNPEVMGSNLGCVESWCIVLSVLDLNQKQHN